MPAARPALSWMVQRGLEPSDWKPMTSVGIGVREIRIHVLGEWRVIYVAKLVDAIYVLHAFQKKRKEPVARISSWPGDATGK